MDGSAAAGLKSYLVFPWHAGVTVVSAKALNQIANARNSLHTALSLLIAMASEPAEADELLKSTLLAHVSYCCVANLAFM